MASDDPVIVSIGRDHYQTHVRIARHEITADEPASVGGTDSGANPYQLLLASIGACKAITLRMYADRKGWDLDQVAIAMRYERRGTGFTDKTTLGKQTMPNMPWRDDDLPVSWLKLIERQDRDADQ